MTKPVVEAYELLAFAQQTAARLVSVAPVLESRAELPRERAWLVSAVEMMSEATASLGPLMERARRLPELKSVRLDQTGDLIAAWVDALEKLLAGFTFHLGSRHPIIQAVFTNPRFPQLRRAAFEIAEETANEVE
ncbi:hypothetical protein L6R52_22640, partial [Myxococcota bacterium]|nr:hypothetical protein [Myxococcota bacterium]